MAFSAFAPKHGFFLAVLLCTATSFCNSDSNPVDIVAHALICFNDQYVYKSCQETFRLNAGGTINVPPNETDHYCDGPCFTETNLVLSCVDGILYNFQFYNGASIQNVRYTLESGCSHTSERGDFNVPERMETGKYRDYGGAYAIRKKLVNSFYFPVLLCCSLILWAY